MTRARPGHSISMTYYFVLATVLFLSALARPYDGTSRRVSQKLFDSLEELARIVDITYCVGTTGIYKPFRCAGRCKEFEGFELVKTWNTGPLLSDSCGYLALSHPPWPKRIILAFRGTYSITNTIVDLSAVPQVYVPYPERPGRDDGGDRCLNCTVHAGFMTSWVNARAAILGPLSDTIAKYPDYQLVVTGHSLGGAVAAIASLELRARGWNPQVTTFGEPRIGNRALAEYLNDQFSLPTDSLPPSFVRNEEKSSPSFCRVTHVDDPVPLLPLSEWGYYPHAGEIFISKPDLPPSLGNLRFCIGDADPRCSSHQRLLGLEEVAQLFNSDDKLYEHESCLERVHVEKYQDQYSMSVPMAYKPWDLFFAHRDYFWRIGVCLPKPENWIPGWKDPKWPWKWKWKWPWQSRI
ncbi:Lipase family protein [Coccidioides posadasii C735 delta SOWgp]|uniref:Lipase family protein n=1 Tax=Coccidioides posadasii (strain C735) TaxID=222929 RepID=C5PEB3_COCP7|nr:Lipase family protein [Coccidioides posadasii C735 delta SOWgp]EER24741.1 Lipase family protein [Coccidioides posadasii C735 delta SOWgp]|eukprot:XP_003066886.1 Lipase family protein [Coccidioides posadasii C735 delta SOWgp]